MEQPTNVFATLEPAVILTNHVQLHQNVMSASVVMELCAWIRPLLPAIHWNVFVQLVHTAILSLLVKMLTTACKDNLAAVALIVSMSSAVTAVPVHQVKSEIRLMLVNHPNKYHNFLNLMLPVLVLHVLQTHSVHLILFASEAFVFEMMLAAMIHNVIQTMLVLKSTPKLAFNVLIHVTTPSVVRTRSVLPVIITRNVCALIPILVTQMIWNLVAHHLQQFVHQKIVEPIMIVQWIKPVHPIEDVFLFVIVWNAARMHNVCHRIVVLNVFVKLRLKVMLTI